MAECKSTGDPRLLSKTEAIEAISQLLDKLRVAGNSQNDFARDLSPRLLDAVEKNCAPGLLEKVGI